MCAAFVVWTKSEMQYFVSTFGGQVFANKTTFSIVAECVAEARKQCNKVRHSMVITVTSKQK